LEWEVGTLLCRTTPFLRIHSHRLGSGWAANGGTQGILWFVEFRLDHSIVLHAYDAANLSHELFNSNQNAERDALGNGAVFIVPTIINGKAYVTSGSAVNVYGLLH
jgi:hypothetical protein